MNLTDKLLEQQEHDNREIWLLKRFDSEMQATSLEEDLTLLEDDLLYQLPHLDFQWAELETQRYIHGYIYTGILIQKIFRHRLWQKKFKSVKEFCEKSLGKTIAYAKRLIQAAKVGMELARAGFDRIPQNESQARPLVKFLPPNWDKDTVFGVEEDYSELESKWEEVLDTCPGPLTAQAVSAVVEPDKAEGKKRIGIAADTYQKLLERANEAGYTKLEDYLDAIANGDFLDTSDTESLEPDAAEMPPAPAEIEIRWLEAMRDKFLKAIGKPKGVKDILNEFLHCLWIERQCDPGGLLVQT